MSVKTRTTGFYRDDAARIAAEAAKIAPPAEPTLKPPKASADPRTPPIFIDEPARPPLAPEPAINENRAAARRPIAQPAPERRSVARLIAWIVLAPFYAAFILGSAALLVLAGKFFLKL